MPTVPGPAPTVVVTIHDVAPSHEAEVRWLLGALDRVGVEQRALAVVPNERANGLIPTDGPLARLLRSEAARGSEILLHGWTHAAEGALRGAWPDRLRAHLFAPHDAEFLSIAPDEATRRLDAGCRALRDLGLPTSGFLAPAWLSPPGLPQSLRATGFTYLVGYTSVLLLASMRRIPAPSIGYFGAGAIQEWLAALGGWMARVVIRRARFSRLPSIQPGRRRLPAPRR